MELSQEGKFLYKRWVIGPMLICRGLSQLESEKSVKNPVCAFKL